MFNAKHFAGAPETCLDFIDNQEYAVFVGDFAQSWKKTWRRRYITTFTLDWFDQESSHLIRMNELMEEHIKMI
jgi:hypothetical protein